MTHDSWPYSSSPGNESRGHRSRSRSSVRVEHWKTTIIVRFYRHVNDVISCALVRRGAAEASGSGGVQRVWAWKRSNVVGLTSILTGRTWKHHCVVNPSFTTMPCDGCPVSGVSGGWIMIKMCKLTSWIRTLCKLQLHVVYCFFLLVIPPPTVVAGGIIFYCWSFFLFLFIPPPTVVAGGIIFYCW